MDIGILIFDQVDLLDCGGPYEVFLTASRLEARAGRPAPFDVFTIGLGAEAVRAYGGLRLVPDQVVEDVDALDVLVVPGAVAIDEVAADARVPAAIRTLAADAGLVASICTGAFLLGAVGLLEGRPWTTHWEDVDLLASRLGSPGTRGRRFVDAGEVVTGGGLSSGIALALHLVARLASPELADATARQIEYPWRPDGGR